MRVEGLAQLLGLGSAAATPESLNALAGSRIEQATRVAPTMAKTCVHAPRRGGGASSLTTSVLESYILLLCGGLYGGLYER